MRKIKSDFKLDKERTKEMKETIFKEYGDNFIGVYLYKDYFIFFDRMPGTLLKHLSVSRKNKKMEEIDIENIAMHFIGENYTINGSLSNLTVHIDEIKIN